MNNLKTYADFLKKFLNPQKPLRVVFDCSNGTTGPIIKQLITNSPRHGGASRQLTTFLINDKPDGNFPAHGPNPSKAGAMDQLKKEVLRQKADLGAIFDADGDRVFFVNNNGEFINPDAIARLLIWQLKPKKVVIDVRTGWLVKNLKSQISNFKIVESKVGHYFIKKLMKKINADFGAEQSGHCYFAFKNIGGEKAYFDSGIMAAIEIINAVSKLPYKLSNYVDLLPQYYRSPELNFKIKNPKQFIKKIESYYNSNLKTKNHLDGLTMEFENWWFNLRPSNTEPLVRLNIETIDKNYLNKMIKSLSSLIKKYKEEKSLGR